MIFLHFVLKSKKYVIFGIQKINYEKYNFTLFSFPVCPQR